MNLQSQEKKLAKTSRNALPSPPFWGLLLTFVALFLLGGSSRADVESLWLLNPVMIMCTGAALILLPREDLRARAYVVTCFVVVILLVLFHLSPGMGGVSSASKSSIYAGSMLGGSAPHTVAIEPTIARQSIYFLFAPLAVLLFAIQFTREDLLLTLPLVIAVGLISSLLGVLQLAGSVDGPLYFYDITNNGSAVGLFANRNHSAVFLACLFPVLAVFAAHNPSRNQGHSDLRYWVAIGISMLLVPLILVTGSRSGMLSAIVGLIGAALIYLTDGRSAISKARGKSVRAMLVASGVLCLVFATIYFSRAEAIERIFADTGLINNRSSFWRSSLKLFDEYFPLGFGPGGFVPAFQTIEPLEMLGSTYLNRLHNDWLETSLTYGVPGVLLLMAGTIYYFYRSFILWVKMDSSRGSVAVGRMASVIIAILGIGSLTDYPLRTPAIAGFAALVILWFGHAKRELNSR